MDVQTKSLIEKEIIEALASYRTSFTIVIQFVIGVLVANVSIIGFALSSNKYDLFFLGAICPIIIIGIRLRASQRMMPLIYTAFHLEKKLCEENIDLLAMTFVATTFSPYLFRLFESINRMESHAERMQGLKKIIRPKYLLFSRINLLGNIIFTCLSICEILLPFIIK